MWNLKCVLLFYVVGSVSSLLMAQETAEQKTKVYVFDAPKLAETEEEKKHSACGFVDVPGNYESFYQAYCKHTKELEDEHFSKKITKSSDKTETVYELIFRHWFAGELFRLVEHHQHLKDDVWWGNELDFVFPGKKSCNTWRIKKYLDENTKNSWVGDNFVYLKMELRFLDMEQGCRIFIHIIVDAKGRRELTEIKAGLEESLRDILAVAEKK